MKNTSYIKIVSKPIVRYRVRTKQALKEHLSLIQRKQKQIIDNKRRL